MAKAVETPGAILNALMDEYQLNPTKLAGEIKLSPSGVRQITTGKTRITAHVALRLSKFFGNTPEYWLDIQNKADLAEAAKDADLAGALKSISKAKKPAPVKKPAVKAAPKAAAKPRAKRAGKK
ncbi:MAG: HigA family addiction module antidote protein [Treponema sp.]|jgi:addiction module HigA family antidote|nr:HigA family addiction module antidote protein [Treponema sp.]